MVESNEQTPLTQSQQQSYDYYDEDGNSIYSENTLKNQKYLRYGLYTAAIVLGLPLVYFLLVFLPNLAPPAVDIPFIARVQSPKYFLHPVIPPLKGPSTKDTDDDIVFSYSLPDVQSDAEDSTEFVIDDKYVQTLKGDNPFKKVPNFKYWKRLDKHSKLYKNHIKKFNGTVPPESASRVILIGDIHGSLDPLKKLMNQIHYNSQNDHVVMLGDFLNKGEDSFGVLEYAIKNQFSCVLGNHEMEILKRYSQFHGLPKLTFISRNGSKEEEPEPEDPKSFDIHINESYDLDELMKIAKHLTPEHIRYMSSCPLIQELGPVPHLTNKKQTKYFSNPANGVGCHAGLLWHIADLEDQDPNTVTTMRNLLPPDFKTPTEDRGDDVNGQKGQFWGKFWAQEQRRIVNESLYNGTDSFTLGTKIYYGHDAHRGLNVREYTTGLDSGCVYGGQLSAEMIWSEVVTNKKGKESIVYKRMLTHVNC